MPTLFISLIYPEDYGTLFPTEEGSASSEKFLRIAKDILQHATIATSIPLGTAHELTAAAAIYLTRCLKSASTVLESEYNCRFLNATKDELANMIVYNFEDDTDLGLFESDPRKANPIEILYPKPNRTLIVCSSMPS